MGSNDPFVAIGPGSGAVTANNDYQKLRVDADGNLKTVSSGTPSLPAGAATSAKQDTGNTSLASIDTKLPSGLTVTSTRLLVDASGATIPVSGPLTDAQLRAVAVPVSGTFWQATQPISAVSLPLPTNASTSALQTTGNTSLANIDTKLPSNLTVTATRLLTDGSGVTQPISAASLPLPTNAATSAKQDTGNTSLGSIDTKLPSNLTVTSTRLLTDGSGVTQPISAVSLPLPTNAATSAKQDTGNTSLANIDTKLPAQGQALAAASIPVVLTAAQVSTLTPLSSVTANAGTNLNTSALALDATLTGGTTKVKAYDSALQAQYNFPAGFVRTSDEPRQLFYDPFDASLDTTDRWSAPLISGGGVAAAVTNGTLTLGSGVTASGYSALSSKNAFTPVVPGWLGESHALKIEFPVTTNAYRFWGHGTAAPSPTTSAPITNGFGFEIDTTGKLFAVVYAAGVRTAVADLSSSGTGTQPANNSYHRYICYYRTDKIFFYIDSLATPVATADFITPAVQSLPHLFLTIAGATPPSSSAVIDCTGVAVWDTAKNNTTLSDGIFGWKKATVKSAALTTNASTDNALLVQESSGNFSKLIAGDINDREFQQLIIMELRGIRTALTAMASEGQRYKPEDFDPANFDPGIIPGIN